MKRNTMQQRQKEKFVIKEWKNDEICIIGNLNTSSYNLFKVLNKLLKQLEKSEIYQVIATEYFIKNVRVIPKYNQRYKIKQVQINILFKLAM
ncbi:MAG: hypothetical protein Q4A10_06405 [Aerococcaceae bacterium]|nr:hypothetical protein [Aerococcaceae bacterium]